MLDPMLFATVSLTSAYVSADSPDQANHYLGPKVQFCFVDSLYTKAIEAVKSQAALSASSHKLTWILGEINSEARL
jgi:hypothetical protein